MESRRNYYRHHFEPEERLPVRLEPLFSRRGIDAQLVNMSLGGMRVRIAKLDTGLQAHDRFRVMVNAPHWPQQLVLQVTVVYVEKAGSEIDVGLRRLPLLDRVADEALQRRLWQFLLEEQRREIRARRAARSGSQRAVGQ